MPNRKTIAVLVSMMAAAGVVAAEGEPFRVRVVPDPPAGRPPMILLPGLSSDGSVWDGVVQHYQRRYDCHVFTVAGFAGVPPVAGLTQDALHEHLADYIRTRKLERPVVVGHSLGGVLALRLAIEEPELVGRLVLVDAVPFLPALWSAEATVESVRPRAQAMRDQMAGVSGEAWRTLQRQSPFVPRMVTGEEDRQRITEWGTLSDPRMVADMLYETWTVDLREAVAEVKAPTLVLAAVKDAPSLFAAYERQYAGLAGARVVRVDSARHFIMYDDPDRLRMEMDTFLGTAPVSSR